jgi:hypothetical protein
MFEGKGGFVGAADSISVWQHDDARIVRGLFVDAWAVEQKVISGCAGIEDCLIVDDS